MVIILYIYIKLSPDLCFVLLLFRRFLPEQLSSFQHSKLPLSLSAHEAQLAARPLPETSSPVSLCPMQICWQHPSVPPGPHTVPNPILPATVAWSHHRELQHHTVLPRQAPLFPACGSSEAEERRAAPLSSSQTGAVGREAGLAADSVQFNRGSRRSAEETQPGGAALRVPQGCLPL